MITNTTQAFFRWVFFSQTWDPALISKMNKYWDYHLYISMYDNDRVDITKRGKLSTYSSTYRDEILIYSSILLSDNGVRNHIDFLL